jgi:hypothetical protein
MPPQNPYIRRKYRIYTLRLALAASTLYTPDAASEPVYTPQIPLSPNIQAHFSTSPRSTTSCLLDCKSQQKTARLRARHQDCLCNDFFEEPLRGGERTGLRPDVKNSHSTAEIEGPKSRDRCGRSPLTLLPRGSCMHECLCGVTERVRRPSVVYRSPIASSVTARMSV